MFCYLKLIIVIKLFNKTKQIMISLNKLKTFFFYYFTKICLHFYFFEVENKTVDNESPCIVVTWRHESYRHLAHRVHLIRFCNILIPEDKNTQTFVFNTHNWPFFRSLDLFHSHVFYAPPNIPFPYTLFFQRKFFILSDLLFYWRYY